jgi:hypothetical protein
MADEAMPQQQFRNQRAEEFVSTYSNNVFFEQTVWDLKFIFGELDLSQGIVDQHTGVTVPWTIAKLTLYYLATQIAGHEIVNGKIHLPEAILPAEPPPLTEEQKHEPNLPKIYAEFKRLHAEFMKGL